MSRKYIVGNTVYEETGERKVVVRNLVLQETTAAGGGTFSIADVDLDESIYDGQTGVVVTITGTVAATGKKCWITQGANTVEQTVTGQTATTVTITVDYGGVLAPGAATLKIGNPL